MGTKSFVQIEINAVFTTTFGKMQFRSGVFDHFKLGGVVFADHYYRTFSMAAERVYRHYPPLCLGSVPRHINFMNWFRDLFDMYRPYPKFFFGFHTEMSHNRNTPVQGLDGDLTTFLSDLEIGGHLNNTLLILMSDHGARWVDEKVLTLPAKVKGHRGYRRV
jgi:membrane-anchored protein YejM (alkaline phosphatase superfamily)